MFFSNGASLCLSSSTKPCLITSNTVFFGFHDFVFPYDQKINHCDKMCSPTTTTTTTTTTTPTVNPIMLAVPLYWRD